MKAERQKAILEIISEYEVETQQQLADFLTQRGFDCTQATLSRDLRELRLVKVHSKAGKNIYAVQSLPHINNEDKLRTIFKESLISFAAAQNLVVVKTIPGLASAAAAAFDSMDVDSLVGTLAGDDTLFIAMKDSQSAQLFLNEIESLI